MVGAPIAGYGSQDNQIGPPAVISAVAEPSQVASGGTVALQMQPSRLASSVEIGRR